MQLSNQMLSLRPRISAKPMLPGGPSAWPSHRQNSAAGNTTSLCAAGLSTATTAIMSTIMRTLRNLRSIGLKVRSSMRVAQYTDCR